ncbi:MAG TPA: ParB/RepB/Spo0J family partition protein [Firmicutes bacterium]|nr:ParB/RepB/Spo0J family partition protein [Bacillota bacterium]
MTKPPRGLGKGLGALIPQLEEDELKKTQELPISQIKVNPYQPRKEFDEASLQELADSIREHGIIQPLLVRSYKDHYQLIAGERRWRAAQIVGLKFVPVVIRDYNDQQMMEIALVENLQREDLNPLEEAEAYNKLIQEFGLTQEEVAQKVGKSRPAVANTLRLLQLPEEIKQLVATNVISMGHARTILSLTDQELQHKVCKEIIEKNLSVRETEELVYSLQQKNVTRETKKAKPKYKDPQWTYLENRLVQHFGTKAMIQPMNKKGKGGKITIEFYSQEELDRILELIFSDANY